MRRGFFLIILLASLCWHALSVAGQSVLLAPTGEREHAILHWQDSAHHHHDDGTIGDEDSPEGLTHLAADGAAQAQALVSTLVAALPPLTSAAPPELEARESPPPLIEGPRRPPRHSA
jgi:hypothetical protein